MYCEAARWSSLLDQALLKDDRMRRIDDGEARQPRIAAQRGAPGDRAAPVVADQRELLDPERIGERENVVDQLVGLDSPRRPAAGPNRQSRAGRA